MRILQWVTLLAAGAGSFVTACFAVAADERGPPQGFFTPQLSASMQPLGDKAEHPVHLDVEGMSPERVHQRKKLLASGESALASLKPDVALQSFERAALIAHAADTEIALVRAYMQSGAYRRALAFAAHTAGAHLDVADGAALYAWLLYIGGQPAIAQRLLLDTEARLPGSSLLKSVQGQLRSGMPRATPELLAWPYRMAPYSTLNVLPARARVLGTGLLLEGGKHALVPLALVSRSGKVWLRNGLGQLVEARLARRTALGIALLSLNQALPTPENMLVSSTAAFPGSVGFAVEYVAATDAAPAWPILKTGFLGGVMPGTDEQKLGIDMPPGPRGGPVFDVSGRLTGLALPAVAGRSDRIVPVSQLSGALTSIASQHAAVRLGTAAPTGAAPKAAVDQVYERSLKIALQVIAEF